jgi:hypothetical protein
VWQESDDGFQINLWTDYKSINPARAPANDVCAVCLGPDGEEGNDLIFCEKCGMSGLLSCVN